MKNFLHNELTTLKAHTLHRRPYMPLDEEDKVLKVLARHRDLRRATLAIRDEVSDACLGRLWAV